MTLLPDSIRTRTVLTLLVGLTASHLASIALYSVAGWCMGTAAWSPGAMASTLVMAVAIIGFSWWASGWITAPLSDFARAAERLGMDVNAPPLAEDGPEEVRAAARAFNQMQKRIRSFVEDRLRMLAAMSHDLRGPITRLRLRTEQLAIGGDAQDKMLADLDEMALMVDSSLAFARDEAAEETSQPVDLAALITTLCDDALDAGYPADFAWEGRLVYRGRPLALKRLFANLIDNAVRYGQRAEVYLSASPQHVQVVVEDDGPGIPSDQMENVFKPFFRLERSRNKRTGGIGLGLATARSIARAHGGDVVLENRPGGGLRATVTLPRQSDVGG
jgi:signal transduction histidine kinase